MPDVKSGSKKSFGKIGIRPDLAVVIEIVSPGTKNGFRWNSGRSNCQKFDPTVKSINLDLIILAAICFGRSLSLTLA